MSSNVLGSLMNTVSGMLSAHGPATEAAAHSYASGDFSVHFFLQLAVILLACRVVGWLGEMAAGLSHEFKNALATLHGYAQLLQTLSRDERGRAAADLQRIFIPFFTTKSKGHGVGLALAHRVITEHNGTLVAQNSTTGGAVLTVRLPIAR